MDKQKLSGFSEEKYNPFIREKSERVLREVLQKLKPKKILEIGTYLGYSASVMLEECPDTQLLTIEKNEEAFRHAEKNLQVFLPRVTLLCCDAKDFLQSCDQHFDLIFLDGAKGQYLSYLPYLKKLLSVGGFLVCDDVLFYGLVQGPLAVKHKHRTIVQRLRAFLEDLQKDENFQTELFTFEDGLLVCEKIK